VNFSLPHTQIAFRWKKCGGERDWQDSGLAFNVLLAFNFTDCRPFYALATLLTFILRRFLLFAPPYSFLFGIQIPRKILTILVGFLGGRSS